MGATLASSILDALLGLKSLSGEGNTGNRFSIERLAFDRKEDGSIEFSAGQIEAASLALSTGPLSLELGRFTLRQVAGQLRIDDGVPRLLSLEVGDAEIADVKLSGPLVLPPPARRATGFHAWGLEPLAGANGSIHAEILDAALVFDVDVTVRIAQGQVDFNAATVEHVGPDSRMGASQLGIYVDAPNGRNLLYPFGPAPVPGVEYERRGPLLGLAVFNRGKLQLQPFVEGQLRQGLGPPGSGMAEQARTMLQRTAVTGEVQLGDGHFAVPGVQGQLTGRAGGRNTVRIRSSSLARELTVDMAALSIGKAQLDAPGAGATCDQITGTPLVRLALEGGQWSVAFSAPHLQASRLRWQSTQPPGA